jgi:membrane protein
MRTLPQWAPVRLARRVLARGSAIDAGTQAAALTYQALLSVIPLVILAGAVIGFVFAGDPARADELTEDVASAIPGLEEVVGRSIDALVDARVSAGLIALAALVWTASSLAGRSAHVIERAFELPDRSWVRKRLTSLLEIVVVGSITLGALTLTSFAARVGGIAATAVGLLMDVVAALLVYVVFTPHGGPGWRAHLPGAAVLGLAFTVLTIAGEWYVRLIVGRATAVYGTVAAIIGLLAILSIACQAFVYGALLSAVLADRGSDGPPEPST